MIVADNGSDMYFQGTPSSQWNMSAVLQISQIRASDFEVVDLTPVVSSLSVNFGSPAGGTSLTITGKNFTGAAGQLHVLFDTVEASSVMIVSDTQLNVVTPAHALGTISVRVQSGHTVTNLNGSPEFFGYGTSATGAASQFNFTTNSTPPPAATSPIAVGGRADGSAELYLPDGNGRYSLSAGASPFGTLPVELRTAVGDVNGDGTPDYLFATGPGTPFQVAVLNGTDRSILVPAFAPFEGFSAGGFVSVGDFQRSGRVQFVVTPDRAGGPLGRTRPQT